MKIYINNWNNIGYSDYVNHNFNKKKNIIKLIKPVINKIIRNNHQKKINLLYIILFLLSYQVLHPSICISNASEFYLRSDMKTENGIVVETNLLMIPADSDYRMKKYNFYLISGHAEPSATPDVLSAAKHNAFSNLLFEKGVKSIHNMSESKNTVQHDETVLSYEGYIKSDYTIKKQGYTDNNSQFSVEIEVWFAPIAYPSEWSMYYFKKKLSDITRNVLSVFK